MNQPPQPNDRVIRVFISSTFRDMMRERDLLVKEVFPELRRKCARRFVTFTEVDLRWGITEAQANEGQVLPLCLAEIERSRPYFIGLLGERYGWIPDTIRDEVIEREPWLKEHVQGRTSVTELEILHGVLNNPAMRHHAFFYFREPAYANNPALTEDERWDMVEHDIRADVEKYGEAEAARRTAERNAKLAALKQRIRESKLPLVEPYHDPEALKSIIRDQFHKLIDDLYPEAEMPDALTRERLAHEAHAKHKLFACIDRPTHLAALNAFAVGRVPPHGGLGDGTGVPGEGTGPKMAGQGLVVTGESGGGKTALLAAWGRDWAAAHPDDFLFQHYFGATPDSASPEGFLTRLLGELKQRFGITEDIPSHPDKLREALPLWLAQASAIAGSLAPAGGEGTTTRVPAHLILVLDGLNQVRGSEPDRRLTFLPRQFPPNVTVIASALPGPALDAMRERAWSEHELPLATEAEVDAMVAAYLGQHARALEPSLRQALVTAPGSKNPLFLRTVLEELRQFGSFEKLPARVGHYLEAQNPKDLFLLVIQRWQDDFDAKDPKSDLGRTDLVRRALTYLWAAREGLSEPEWLDLLGMSSPQPSAFSLQPSPLPRAHWTPLFLALEPHLSQRAGLFAYGHDFLRQAVEAAFASTQESKTAGHLTLADYFEHHPNQQEITPRKAFEWPFQLHAAAAWDRLETCLTDIPLFLALYTDKTQWELTGYWHPLRQRDREMGACYTAAYAQWTAAPGRAGVRYVPAQLGQFLSENGRFPAAEPLLKRALASCEQVLGPEHPDTLTSVNNLATLLERKGDYAGAQPLYQRALEARERVLGPEHPDTLTSVNNLANLLEGKGDYAGAQPFYQRALEASERVLGLEHPDTLASVNNLAHLLEKEGDYAGAQPLHERALAGCERVLGPEHPNTLMSMNNLARLLFGKGDYARAMALFRRAFQAGKRVLGPEHPDTLKCLKGLAVTLESEGNYSGAEPLMREELQTSERILGFEHPETLGSLNNLGRLLMRAGKQNEAEPLYRRALKAREAILGMDHPETLGSLNSLAVLLVSRGDNAGAQPLYERALEGLLRVSAAIGRPHPNLQTFVGNYTGCLKELGRSPQQIRSALGELCQRYGFSTGGAPDDTDTPTKLTSLADQLDNAGRGEEAAPVRLRAIEIQERTVGPDHPDTLRAWDQYAYSIRKQGRADLAEPFDRKLLASTIRALGEDAPLTIHRRNNLVLSLIMLGRLEETRAGLESNLKATVPLQANTTPRVWFLEFLVDLIENRPTAQPLGRLKTFLRGEPVPNHPEITVPWDAGYFLEAIKAKVPADVFAFLAALVAALNDRANVAKLDEFPAWREATPGPLN